jgi:DNA-directed RNA polymerase specialized sigma24 family protein
MLRMRSSSRAGLSRAELGRQAAAGEPHALQMLLERLYVDMVRYYGCWLRDHSDAGDLIVLLAEEALLRLAGHQLPVLPTDDEWVAYALHVARSVAIDLLDHDAVRGAPAPGRLPGAGAPGRLQDAPRDPAPAGGAP